MPFGAQAGTLRRVFLHFAATSIALALIAAGTTGTDLAAASAPVAAGPSARNGAAMAPLFGSRAILFGGQDASGPLGDTWEFDGATRTWRQITPEGFLRPSPRWGAAIAFDHGVIYLFGGEGYNAVGDLTFLNDLWKFDGQKWELVYHASGGLPEARAQAQMVYDPVARSIVLFGGRDSNDRALGNTWSFDGVTWQLHLVPTAPPPRFGHVMAWHEHLRETMLFGGSTEYNIYRDTWTWTFDGTDSAWREQLFSGAEELTEAALWHDPTTRSLLFQVGGRNLEGPVQGTWHLLSLSGWESLKVSSPPARFRHSVAYLPDHQIAVLFGGTDGQVDFGDTWLWEDSKWKKLK